MFSRNRNLVLLLAIVLVLAVTASCAPDEEPVEPDPDEDPKRGGEIVIGFTSNPDNLDAHQTSAIVSNNIMAHIGSALVNDNPYTDEVEPGLAESFVVSDDGQVITFQIREGVEFHDGTAMTAHEVKWTYDRARSPDIEAHVADDMLGPVSENEVPDDYTLIVRKDAPSAPFLRNLASSGYLHPMNPDYVEDMGADYGRNPMSVGPWVFDEWVTGQYVTMVRNEDFAWAPSWFDNDGPPYPDRLTYRFIPEEATLLAALERGDIDIVRDVPVHAVGDLEAHPNIQLYSYQRMGIGQWVAFNQKMEIWHDERHRMAVAHAIDKEHIIETSLDGRGEIAYSVLAPGMIDYHEGVEEMALGYQPDTVAELLEDAGWEKDGEWWTRDGEIFEVEALVQATEGNLRDTEMVQAHLAEVGIKMNINSYERALHVEKRMAGEYDIVMGTYSWSSGDPDVLSFMFHSSQAGTGMNYFWIQDEYVDSLLEQGRTTVDPTERTPYYHELQEHLISGTYVVPIYVPTLYWAINERVQDVDICPRGTLQLHDAYID